MTDERERPLVSLVITTRNRSDMVREAIDSALALDNSTFDLEIVVVDDGSTDDTPEVLGDYPVRVVRTTGVGIGNARTCGLQAATGDFIQFLDDDDVLLPRAIISQLEEFDRHPEYGAVHARTQMTNSALEPFLDPIPPPGLRSGWILEDLITYWPQIATVLTRGDVARQLERFNPFPGDSEWDFFLRTARDWPIGRIDDVVMLFRQRDGQAEEEQQWRRSRATKPIFTQAIAHLPLRDRLRLRPVLWARGGWHSSTFLGYAVVNWSNGERRRAAKSLWYALRWSPLHTGLNVIRLVLHRRSERPRTPE